MKTTSRGGDGNFGKADGTLRAGKEPPNAPDLDAAIKQAMQARLFYHAGVDHRPDCATR